MTREAGLHERMKRLVAEAWPGARPARRSSLNEYNIYRSAIGVNQRCWIFRDDEDEAGVYVVLFVELEGFQLEGPPGFDLNIRLRTDKPPSLGLDEQQVAPYVIDLAEDLSTPEKVKKLTWNEATSESSRFAGRVQFAYLARMHSLACLASGKS